jgi:thiol-disulfide isomerase/thioredoxin
MNRRYGVAALLMCASLMVSTVSTAAPAQPPLPPGLLPVDSHPAPALALSDIDGKAFRLADHRGRWVFVHFWASWCGPCRREIPAIQRMVEKLPQQLLLAIVNTAEDEDTVFNFLGVLAPDLVPLLDRDGLVTEQWQPRGLPATYLVDPQGRIRFQALGGRPWDSDVYLHFLSTLAQ